MIKKVRYRNRGTWLLHGTQILPDVKWNLCVEPVFKIFDIPSYAKIVWLAAHKRPSVNRVQVKLYVDDFGFKDIEVDGRCELWLPNTKQSIIRLLMRHGTFHVSAEYTI